MKEMVNIVIPAWNDFEFLTECLESIPKACQDSSFFITIVDNGSEKSRADKFYEYLKDEDFIHVHRNKKNMGFPIACNIGAKRKACPLIFFLNADVVLHEHAIDNLIMTMDDPEVGVVGMKLLFSENSPHGPAGRIQHAGLVMDIRARPYHLFLGWTENNSKVMAMDDVWAVTGAGLMVRRSLWNKVGGFDEQYGLGCLVGETLLNTDMGIKSLDSLNIVDRSYPLDISIAGKNKTELTDLFYKNGEHEVIKITTQKRFSLTGTSNHRLVSMTEEGEIVWKALEDLEIGDYVALRRGSNLFGTWEVNKDIAYLAGLYIAEGSHEKDGNYERITITNTEKEIRNFLQFYKFSVQKDEIHWRSSNRNKELLQKLRDLGIDFSKKALTKEIPNKILAGNRRTQVAFLRGLFDGDGSGMKNGKVIYTSSSIKLIKQLQIVLLNFGIVSAIYSKDEKLSNNKAYILDLLGDSKKFYNDIGFAVKRKQKNLCYVPKRRSDVIPYQREYLKFLYKLAQKQVGGFWKEYSMYTLGDSHAVSRAVLNKILNGFSSYTETREYKAIQDNINNDYVWLKITQKDNIGIEQTYDLHVPNSHSYIANGFVVHNTFEDLDLCLTIKELGYKIKVNMEAVGTHYVGHCKAQFPLNRNHQLFMNKWGEKVKWNEWKYL